MAFLRSTTVRLAADAAEKTQRISIVATAVDQTLIRRYVVPYAFPKGADGSSDRAAIEAVRPDLRGIFTVLNARLDGRDYLEANHFTFADALLLATLNPALRKPEAAEIADEVPAVRRYFALHSQRRSCVETGPPEGLHATILAEDHEPQTYAISSSGPDENNLAHGR
jgi:glutathione S-transferase